MRRCNAGPSAWDSTILASSTHDVGQPPPVKALLLFHNMWLFPKFRGHISVVPTIRICKILVYLGSFWDLPCMVTTIC